MDMNYVFLENELQQMFGLTDYEKTHKCEYKMTYGEILYDNIKNKGGLYTALAVVLAPHYYEHINEIEKFLSEIEDINELKLDEIDKGRLKKIVNRVKTLIS